MQTITDNTVGEVDLDMQGQQEVDYMLYSGSVEEF